MKMFTRLILGAIVICAGVGLCFSQDDAWKRFTPLKNTREEVERVIGKPIRDFDTFGIYSDSPNVEYTVWYSSGTCESTDGGRRYKVPRGVLTQMGVAFKSKWKLSNIVGDPSKLTRVVFPMNTDIAYYYSADESLIYKSYIERDGSESIQSITIQPGNNAESLRCDNRA